MARCPTAGFPGSEGAKERKIAGAVEVVAVRQLGLALVIERQIGRVGHRGAARNLAELAQLLRGELGLDRPSPSDDVDLFHFASRQSIEGVLGNVRAAQLVHRLRQDAGHVRSHVALPNDRHGFLAQVERPVTVVRVAIEPADELGSGMTAGQILARNPHAAVRLRAASEHQGVVTGAQLRDRNVPADLHIAEEVEPGSSSDALVHQDRLLELRVVRCNAASHEAERRRQALDHVHSHRKSGSQERFRRIEAARPGTDDGDVDRGNCVHCRHDVHRARDARPSRTAQAVRALIQ